VLSTADGKFTFVDNFATPSNLKVSLANTLEPFVDNSNGTLSAVANGAAGLPKNPPLLLGLVEDPVHHIIYTGQAPTGGVATFTYNDTTGKASYVGSTASEGAGTCWLNISPDGKFLYATDSASDALSVYSLANPLKPAFIQEFYLNGPTHNPASSSSAITSDDFQFSFDSTGNYLYVLNHTTDDSFQQGNQLHVLSVGANGKLSETSGSPLFFPASYVPAIGHVQGLAVVTKPNEAANLQNTLSQLFSEIGISTSSTSGATLETLLDSLLAELVTASN
jgi:DNA-binding beta-propeller fold protein YncE